GSLLVDLSEGKTKEEALAAYTSKVSSYNYRRTTAVAGETSIELAKAKIEELGLTESLHRRHATVHDIPVTRALFLDREVTTLDPFTSLKKDLPVKKGKLKNLKELSLEDFIKTKLPTCTSLEVMLDSSHKGNLMSVIAPTSARTASLFRWDNGLSWAYANDVADSTKELVKAKGGKVDGVMRFSIRWNDEGDNNIDFDAHCLEPNGNLIFFGKVNTLQASSGILDVDVQSPGKEVAVENITWGDKAKIQAGKHVFMVHNYAKSTSTRGFTAEIEFEGVTTYYSYDKPLRGKQTIKVAVGVLSTTSLKLTSSRQVESNPQGMLWNLEPMVFHKVSIVIPSPNYWETSTGNRHTFFILEDLRTKEQPRGMFNEFLKTELVPQRKVFEQLGNNLRVADSEDQLSGVGFSSTERASIVVRVNNSKLFKVMIN
ncbi:MAG: hypothetical protein DRQ44_18565, partial [Gammaproteobacteria bacterium]